MTREEKLAYHRAYNREWYQRNKEHVKTYDEGRRAIRQEANLYKCAKARAKREGSEFNLTLDDVVIPQHCPIMGWELTAIYGQGRVKTNPSLDRIDSTKGYVKGNVQVISDLANRMKQDASPEELQRFANGINAGPRNDNTQQRKSI